MKEAIVKILPYFLELRDHNKSLEVWKKQYKQWKYEPWCKSKCFEENPVILCNLSTFYYYGIKMEHTLLSAIFIILHSPCIRKTNNATWNIQINDSHMD